jgi:hypothetical protein
VPSTPPALHFQKWDSKSPALDFQKWDSKFPALHYQKSDSKSPCPRLPEVGQHVPRPRLPEVRWRMRSRLIFLSFRKFMPSCSRYREFSLADDSIIRVYFLCNIA